MSKAQCERILQHLQKGNTVTPLTALAKFNCLRLSARILELRQQGHEIITETIKRNGKQFARYKLIQ